MVTTRIRGHRGRRTVTICWLCIRPQVLNYPGEVTEGNAQAVYREHERLVVWLLVGLMASTLGGLVRLVIAETPK